MDAIERETLLAAARVDRDVQRLRLDVFAEVVDEPALWALAQAHQIEFRLVIGLPSPSRDRLLAHLAADQLQRQARVDRLLAADRRLKAAGVSAVWLKGPALAQRLFGDPLWRRSRDLDVLVDDVAAATAAVGDPDVDVAAFLPGMPLRTWNVVKTCPVSIAGEPIQTLADADAALCACATAAKLPFKLGRVADAADLLNRGVVDPLPVALHAGVGDAVGLGMALAAQIGSPIFSAGRFTPEAQRRFAEFLRPNAAPRSARSR